MVIPVWEKRRLERQGRVIKTKELMEQKKTADEIAAELGVSANTVKGYMEEARHITIEDMDKYFDLRQRMIIDEYEKGKKPGPSPPKGSRQHRMLPDDPHFRKALLSVFAIVAWFFISVSVAMTLDDAFIGQMVFAIGTLLALIFLVYNAYHWIRHGR